MEGKYEVIREGEESVLRFDCNEYSFFPSVEDNARVMTLAIEALAQVGRITKLTFVQKRDIEYDESQVNILAEIAQIYRQASSQRVGIPAKFAQRYINLQSVQRLLKSDPVGAYVELKRLAREEDRQIDAGILKQDDVQLHTH